MSLYSLWTFFGLCYIASSSDVYYLTPYPALSNGNCSVNGTTLSPCFTFEKFIKDEISFNSDDSLVLYALSGTHFIPTLQVHDLNKLVLRSWDEHEVIIQCQFNSRIIFERISSITILSMQFSHCALQFSRWHLGQSSINIEESFFKNSESGPAVQITSFQAVQVIVANSTFISNNGGLWLHTVSSGSSLPESYLKIVNTLLHHNGFPNERSAIEITYTRLTVVNSHFMNNSASRGGAIAATNKCSLRLYNTAFVENHADIKGSAIYLQDSAITTENCQFINNSVNGNGALVSEDNIVQFSFCQISLILQCRSYSKIFLNNTIFRNNHAKSAGGALYIILDYSSITVANCRFISNSAKLGGALYFQVKKLFGISSTTFLHNEAKSDGSAIYCNHTTIRVTNGYSYSNSAVHGSGGYVYLSSCAVSFENFNISSNTASRGGAIYAVNSSITLFATMLIQNNIASEYGGALYLINSAVSLSRVNANVILTQNKVTSPLGKGGAIFVLDSNCRDIVSAYSFKCFLHDDLGLLTFSNNSANEGSILYGGLLDRCYNSTFTGRLKYISEYVSTPLAVTSDPVRVCLCSDDHTIDCSKRELTLTKMRGEKFDILGATVDQEQTPKASFLRARYTESEAKFGEGEGTKETTSRCSNLSFHIFAVSDSATLILQPEGYCERASFSTITVHITIQTCTRGLSRNKDRCECEKRLMEFTTACSVGTDSIQRKGSVWLRYDETYFQVHRNCPLDYCQATTDTLNLKNPDGQCANHRSGVLCGACRDNYSMAFGSSKCLQCSSSYSFIWLIPVFAVAGMALVALLLVLNMTISHGTLNELIFYANVVSISGLTNLRICSIHPILSVFIAWINLDFGIETCFYSRMDTYQKTWLQFAFPLYLWLLVGAIIIASYYSSTAMKVFGRNNVAILATLFLLSYTKILKTIITAINFTEVFQARADNASDPLVPYKVWLYDGNIVYAEEKHAPLLAVALFFLVFLFLPYTLLLTFGQCLRSMPVRRRYVQRCIRSTVFVSIMDAYHAPYKKRHRYWIGLTLLTRCVLFLTFASSYQGSELPAHMYITTLILLAIFVLKMTCAHKVYLSLWKNILELCFLLNLTILSTTLYFLESDSSSICTCTSISVSVSVALLAGIMAYHCSLRISKTRSFVNIRGLVLAKWRARKSSPTSIEIRSLSHAVDAQPTTTNMDLREVLLSQTD